MNKVFLRNFFSKIVGKDCKIEQFKKINKSIHGRFDIYNGQSMFFKILGKNEARDEFINYLKISPVYPVPKMKFYYILKEWAVLIYDYEHFVDRRGLFFDSLNEKRYNKKSFEKLIKIYRRAFNLSKVYRKSYPLEKFFSGRVNSRLKDVLKNKAIKEILDYKIIINGENYKLNTRNLINETSSYFTRKRKELCFLSQGDPEPINLGTKPILFDFESSGINPLLAEFAIFLWGVFMEESYYALKYHKKAYRDRFDYRSLVKNKPKLRYKIDKKKRVLKMNLQYSISEVQKDMLLEYYNKFFKKVMGKDAERILGCLKYFMAMRILTTLNFDLYKKEDIYSSIAFLHLFYNLPVSNSLNRRDSLSKLMENKYIDSKPKKMRVRAVIISQGELSLVNRVRDGDVYYVFPGGGVEVGEDPKEALGRECLEEIGVQVSVRNRIYTLVESDGSTEEFYCCTIKGGKFGAGMGPEYTQYKGRGIYMPVNVSLSDIPNLRILPSVVAKKLYQNLKRYGNVRKIPFSELKR